MAAVPMISRDEATEAYAALMAAEGNKTHAAQALGIPRKTLAGRLDAHLRYETGAVESKVEFPEFVYKDEKAPIEDVIDRLSENFRREHAVARERKWFPVKVKEDRPYGVMLIGDPHLDDNGCNWPLLREHIEIAKKPGIYGLNIGDSSNNWVGRLMRLYADQDTSESTAKQLVEWFLLDSGITWLCWILGNHDMWADGTTFHRLLGKNVAPVIDWHAQFKLAHPSGTEVKIDACHGRKGNSIWNNIHSTLRAAKLNEQADLFVTGHTHNFAIEDIEIAERGHSAWLVQLRGYKFHDHYALTHGFAEHQRGASVLAVIDPSPGARTRVQCFEDVAAGADFLEHLRARR